MIKNCLIIGLIILCINLGCSLIKARNLGRLAVRTGREAIHTIEAPCPMCGYALRDGLDEQLTTNLMKGSNNG